MWVFFSNCKKMMKNRRGGGDNEETAFRFETIRTSHSRVFVFVFIPPITLQKTLLCCCTIIQHTNRMWGQRSPICTERRNVLTLVRGRESKSKRTWRHSSCLQHNTNHQHVCSGILSAHFAHTVFVLEVSLRLWEAEHETGFLSKDDQLVDLFSIKSHFK